MTLRNNNLLEAPEPRFCFFPGCGCEFRVTGLQDCEIAHYEGEDHWFSFVLVVRIKEFWHGTLAFNNMGKTGMGGQYLRDPSKELWEAVGSCYGCGKQYHSRGCDGLCPPIHIGLNPLIIPGNHFKMLPTSYL